MKHQKETEWHRLDIASRIFPSTYSSKDPKVFRLTCELHESIKPDILQEALNITIEDFPLFKSVLRRGIFWYYLEMRDIQSEVMLESQPICSPIYLGHKRTLLFRVLYYKKRINLEVFHALSDGDGAMWFLRTLVNHYLSLRYGNEFLLTASMKNNIINKQMDDSFDMHFSGNKATKKNIKKAKNKARAFKIRETWLAENRTRLIEASMPVQAVLEQAHTYNTTITRFIAAIFMLAIYKEMPARGKKHPVVLSIPINMRQFFESSSARNFFSTMDIKYYFTDNNNDLSQVIQAINIEFEKELTADQLKYKLDQYIFLAQNPFVRIVPRPIKDIVLRIGARITDKGITSGISNLGEISMPEENASYINQFSVCMKARSPRITLCSYNDKLIVSFTSPFNETNIQRNFFRSLAEMGIRIEISTN